MGERTPELDIRQFRVLGNLEFRGLSFAEKLLYLRFAIQARRRIDEQVEEMLLGIAEQPPD